MGNNIRNQHNINTDIYVCIVNNIITQNILPIISNNISKEEVYLVCLTKSPPYYLKYFSNNKRKELERIRKLVIKEIYYIEDEYDRDNFKA